MDAFEKWDEDFAYGANESLTATLRAIRKDAFQAGRRAGMEEAARICEVGIDELKQQGLHIAAGECWDRKKAILAAMGGHERAHWQ